MSAFYKQDEDDYNLRLVCPACGDEVLLSEYRETVFCEACGDEFPIFNALSRINYESVVSIEGRTEK